MTFDELNLNKPLLQALADLEYEYPTPIQEKVFPVIMSGSNVIGIAQTGTGKTFAYLLPLLRNLTYSDKKDPRLLIVAPTRELAIQIFGELQKLTKYLPFRLACVYGGVNITTQKQTIANGLDILVATPGRLIDLVFTGVLKLKNIQKLVIDEVDEMLGLGFRSQLSTLLEMLPVKRQNLLFSATLSPGVEAFVENTILYFQKIEITPQGTPLEEIIQKAYQVPNFYTKVNLLEKLLMANPEMNKVLLFAGTKKLADRLFDQAEKIFPGQAAVIHSNKSHNQRIGALKLFQENQIRLLIATDIIARGMDIADVSHVINFDMPEEPGDYIHRIGRTGRAGKVGIAISFVNPVEQTFLKKKEEMMKIKIVLEKLPSDVKISNILTDDETPEKLYDKNYLKVVKKKNSQNAIQEKKEKNKKINLGGPKKRNKLKDKFGNLKVNHTSKKTRF